VRQEARCDPCASLQLLGQAGQDLASLYEALELHLLSLGDDVQLKTLKYYFTFKRIRNFACVEIHPQSKKLIVYVKIAPDSIDLQQGFTRDVRKIGHYGTGELEITISDAASLVRAKPLLQQSYDAS